MAEEAMQAWRDDARTLVLEADELSDAFVAGREERDDVRSDAAALLDLSRDVQKLQGEIDMLRYDRLGREAKIRDAEVRILNERVQDVRPL